MLGLSLAQYDIQMYTKFTPSLPTHTVNITVSVPTERSSLSSAWRQTAFTSVMKYCARSSLMIEVSKCSCAWNVNIVNNHNVHVCRLFLNECKYVANVPMPLHCMEATAWICVFNIIYSTAVCYLIVFHSIDRWNCVRIKSWIILLVPNDNTSRNVSDRCFMGVVVMECKQNNRRLCVKSFAVYWCLNVLFCTFHYAILSMWLPPQCMVKIHFVVRNSKLTTVVHCAHLQTHWLIGYF